MSVGPRAVAERVAGRRIAVAVDAQHLAAQRPLLLRLGRVTSLPGRDEEVAVAVEQESATMVAPADRDAGEDRPDVAEPVAVELDSDAVVVMNANNTESSSGSSARPSSPPSPPGCPTEPRTSPIVVTLPSVVMRTIEPSSRCATSASPLGRNTMPHGTLSPSAMVPATRGLSSSWPVRVGDGVGDSPGRAGGSSSLQPNSVTAPSPANPARTVRRSTMLRSSPRRTRLGHVGGMLGPRLRLY